MKYKIEQFVAKINAPIVCRFDGEELSFENGKDLAEYQFDKRYEITELTIEDGKVIACLSEQPVPNMNWVGEEAVSFF